MKKKLIIRYSIIAGVVLIVFFTIAKRKGWIGDSDAVKISAELAQNRNITEIVSASGRIAKRKRCQQVAGSG